MRENHENRVSIFIVLLVIVFLVYSARLFSMQILSGEIHLSRAQDISRRTYSIPTQRGEIFDRHFSQPLVINRDTFAVTITPADIPRGSIDSVISSVSKILKIPESEIRAKLPSQYLQTYQPVEIASNVPFSDISALAENKNTLPGISWHIKSVRNYVDVGSLSHILGYVGDITRDELTALYNLGYQSGDMIGKAGIEKQYDMLLRGTQGWETRTVDSRGRRITGSENIVHVAPEMGKNLVLTIDASLQKLAEKALGDHIGTIVVLRPSTGEVLAMVSKPWYDPNIFTDGLTSEIRAVMTDTSRPLINRAINSSYPPASTFKLVMSTAIVADNVFPRNQLHRCTGSITYGGRIWNCHNRAGHGSLGLTMALVRSCNVYFWEIGRDYVGIDRIVDFARGYGYGQLTGIDLPGESEGLIPDQQWKLLRHHENWTLGDTMNLSIGQGFALVTPLQMANLVSMIVNGGVNYKPHVLKEVRNPVTNEIEFSTEIKVLHQSNISPLVYEAVRQDMREVVLLEARWPFNLISAVEVAGKTGTAQIGVSERWHSWLTTYGPYNSTNPNEQIVITAFVENTSQSYTHVAEATGIVYQGYFANQTYEEAVRALYLWDRM